MHHETNPARVIDLKALKKLIPYSAQHIARLEAAGKFPKRIALGPNRVGWLLVEVEAWVQARVSARDASKRALDGGTL